MSKKIEEAFNYAKENINGLKAMSVVEVDSGLSHGSLIIDDKFDLDAASAYNSEVLKAKIKAKNAMGMQKEKIDLMLIELTTQIHMIQPTSSEEYLIYMATDKSSSNIGITRKVMLEVASQIDGAVG